MARPKIENHKTAGILLQSAKKHFLQKGFEGTSIADIADEAHINKSLIYHHFGNKETLWKAVKEKIIENANELNIEKDDFKRATFKEFLHDFVTFRFHVYARNPELVRLMHWQRLESNNALAGISNRNFTELQDYIHTYQQSGEIRTDIPSEMIMYLILSMPVNGFLDRASFLSTKMGQANYLSLIIENLLLIFSPNKHLINKSNA